MAMKQISKSGYDKLKEELDYLVGVKRAEMAQKLKEARAQGDLSENADYKAAKEDQGFLEGRILELESTLANAIIVDDAVTDNSVVQIGSTVTILEDGDEEEQCFGIFVSEGAAHFMSSLLRVEAFWIFLFIFCFLIFGLMINSCTDLFISSK